MTSCTGTGGRRLGHGCVDFEENKALVNVVVADKGESCLLAATDRRIQRSGDELVT